MNEKPQRRDVKPVRRVSARYLRNAGLYYVQKYAATEQRLRRVLMRRVDKSFEAYGSEEGAHKEGDRSAYKQIVEDLIKEFVRLSYVDDAKFALGKARRLYRGNNSLQQIRGKLQLDGIDGDKVDVALDSILLEADLTEAAINRKAAWAFVKKKRIGPFRDEALRQDTRKKDLGALARRGFGADIAYSIIDADEIPEEVLEGGGLGSALGGFVM